MDDTDGGWHTRRGDRAMNFEMWVELVLVVFKILAAGMAE